MEMQYHFLEPGEHVALIRLAQQSAEQRKAHIVFTMREADVLDKIRGMRPRGAYLDYDGTLTHIGETWGPIAGSRRRYTTAWQEIRALLPSAGQQALQRHYELYKHGDLTAMEWLYISVAAYQEHDLKLADVLRATSQTPFREGFEAFFSLLTENFDSRAIVSFGLRDVIQAREELAGFPCEILASDLIVDGKDRIVGVKASITEENKGLFVRAHRNRHRLAKKDTVGIGNSWHDRHLFQEVGFSIYLAHSGYKGAQIDHAAEIEQLKSIATAIVFDDTLHGVNHLIRCIVSQTL